MLHYNAMKCSQLQTVTQYLRATTVSWTKSDYCKRSFTFYIYLIHSPNQRFYLFNNAIHCCCAFSVPGSMMYFLSPQLSFWLKSTRKAYG
jgi:hypothetical protein